MHYRFRNTTEIHQNYFPLSRIVFERLKNLGMKDDYVVIKLPRSL